MNILALWRRAGSLAMAGVAALVSPLPSSAASASASLTNISLSVVDLDLTDGITAGFSFVDGLSFTTGHFGAATILTGGTPTQFIREPGFFVPSSGSASIAGAQTSGAITSNGLEASGSTSAPGRAFVGVVQSGVSGPFQTGVELTPHSQLMVRADYSASATAMDVCGGTFCERADAFVFITTEGDLPSGGITQVHASAVAQRGDGVVSTGPQSGSFHIPLDNIGDSIAEFQLSFSAQVSGASPIPEPETYALMLLGLGGLGVVSRRHKRR